MYAVKRPIPILCYQWMNTEECFSFLTAAGVATLGYDRAKGELLVEGEQDSFAVEFGAYVMKDALGFWYRCPEEVFKRTYDLVNADAQQPE